MKQLLITFIFFIGNYILIAQKMTGIVYDAEQNPIPNATVAFKQSAKAVSNNEGKFIFEKLYQESIKKICENPQELSVSINGIKHNFTAEVNCTQNRIILNVNSIIGKKALITLITEGITNEKVTLEFDESGQNYKSDSKGQIIMSHRIMNRLCNKRINPQFKVVSNNDENKNYEVSSWSLDCDTKVFKVSLTEKTKTEEKNNTSEAKDNEKTEEKTAEKSNTKKPEEKPEEKSNEKTESSKENNKTDTNNDNRQNFNINLLESEKELAILVENGGQKFLAMPVQKQAKFIEYHIEKLNEQNKTIEAQIKSLENILKNDATLSEEEKLDISDQINALRKKLHLNKLAAGNLNERLIDLHKSFFQRYLNAIIIFAVILIALGAVAYLLAILAKRRKKQRDEIAIKNQEIELQKQESERLLLNILPEETAQELKKNGQVAPKLYDSASVLFTDFQGFSSIAKELTPEQVISELDFYFGEFEKIGEKFSLEKIKTMGDAFMAVGGLPLKNQYNAIDTVCAALQMQKFIQDKVKENIEKGQKPWNVRIGIHTGELVAGVIGKTKFAYDVWGNTVNLAARMESSSENGKIQITQFTYDLVKDYFDCTLRGEIEAKNIGKIHTYFVNSLKPEYSNDGFEPNQKYWGRTNA